MPLQDNLTNDREKRYTSKHQLNDLANVLRRSVETEPKAAVSKRALSYNVSARFLPQLRSILRTYIDCFVITSLPIDQLKNRKA